MWPLLTADINWQENGKAIAMLETQDISQVHRDIEALETLVNKSLYAFMLQAL